MDRTPIAPPSPAVLALAQERLAGLATPPGALGPVGELGAWLAAAQGVVPPGAWQSARSRGDWSLVGCTVAPGFDFAHFELAPPGWAPA